MGIIHTLILIVLLATSSVVAQVPKPEEVFGFPPGADYKLADYQQMLEYYRRLDAASPRVQVMEIGSTAEGRPMILALISSEQNLARAERYRQVAERLARARIPEEQAEELVREGRAVVWIDGGLHATEVAHAQHSPLLAYRVATEETEEMRRIRENVILLQMPVMNPDGLEIVVNWYRTHLGTPFETSPLPELYHKYVGHDNNRDWFMITQPETLAVTRILYHRWYPQIVYNHHQTAPFPARIFIPPFAPPMNPNIPPQVLRGIDLVGSAMSARFEAEGKAGVVSRLGFTTWWNGGMRTAPYFHNMVGILTETALYRYATPHQYDPQELPKSFSNGLPTLEPSADYPNPWKGGWWRLGDAVEYMMTASLAVLDVGARFRDAWLKGIYRMGREAILQGQRESPAAYLVPLRQHDPSAAVALVEVLRRGGIEIHQALEDFRVQERDYPRGTFVISASQAFRPHLVDLMEPQRYPDRRAYPGGPPLRPYDVTGWTLPLQMGVEVVRLPQAPQVALQEVREEVQLPLPEPPVQAESYLLDRRWNRSFRLLNDWLKEGGRAEVLTGEERIGEESWPAGTLLLRGDWERARRLAEEHRVPLQPAPPQLQGTPQAQPRLGLYRSWVANMDEGWTRWLLEQYHFPYRRLTDADIRRGGLAKELDVILLPSQDLETMLRGHEPGRMPPQYTGGLGLEGFQALRDFAREGGILVALDDATELPASLFNLPVEDVLARVESRDFYCPGSLLKLELDPSDPVAWGMPPQAAASFVNSHAFRVIDGEGARVAARYGREPLLLSGWILGEGRIAGRAAVIRLPLEQGQVVLIGFRSQFRGQPHGTFKLLFNSILLGGLEKGE